MSDFFIGRRSFPCLDRVGSGQEWFSWAKTSSRSQSQHLLAMYKLLKRLLSRFKIVSSCLLFETHFKIAIVIKPNDFSNGMVYVGVLFLKSTWFPLPPESPRISYNFDVIKIQNNDDWNNNDNLEHYIT